MADSHYRLSIEHVGGKAVKLVPGATAEHDFVEHIVGRVAAALPALLAQSTINTTHPLETARGLEDFITSVAAKDVGWFKSTAKVTQAVREAVLELASQELATLHSTEFIARLRVVMAEAVNAAIYAAKDDVLP